MKVTRLVTIGTVVPGEGEHSAIEAAFLLIAKDGAEQGTYEFDLQEEAMERGIPAEQLRGKERVRLTIDWPDYEAYQAGLTDEPNAKGRK